MGTRLRATLLSSSHRLPDLVPVGRDLGQQCPALLLRAASRFFHFSVHARSGSADRDPRTTSGHDNHGADEKVSRDWGKQPGTLHAMSSTYNLSLQDAA